jgi:hypothetical protein
MLGGSSFNCPRCGTALLAEVKAHAVVTFEGETVPFRRHTDFIMCSCLASWRVTDLHEAAQLEDSTRS